MSLIVIDSFDHYNTVAMKWDASAFASIVGAAARTGAQGLQLNQTGAGNQAMYAQKNVSTITTFFTGFAFNAQSVGAGTLADTTICSWVDGASIQCALSIRQDGHLYFTRSGSTGIGGAIIVGPSTLAMTLGVWHYIETKVTISGTVGICEVKVDGVFFLQGSALNNQNTGNASIGAFQLGSSVNNVPQGTKSWYDDLVFFSSVGAQNNTYLGDVRVDMILPTANGTVNNYTRGGTDQGANWKQVNENPPDDDVTYVLDGTVNDQDRYTYAPLNFTGQVLGVAVNMRAKKDAAGTRSLRAVTKSGATVADNGVDFPCQITTYGEFFQGFFEVDPNTAAQWTSAAVNSGEFGPKTSQ